MRKSFLLAFFLFLIHLTAGSQINRSGTPMISWFDAADTPGDLLNHCITTDKRGVMYFGNESSGIVTYDGTAWGLIPMLTTQRVNALNTDYRGVVYAGGETDFGLLQPDLTGRMKYSSLADRIADSTAKSEVGPILAIDADSSNVYLTDGRKLYIVDIESDSVSVIELERDYGLNSVSRILTSYEMTILADDRQGLFEYRDGKITPLPGGEKIRMVRFAALLSYDRDNILVATAERGLVVFNHRTGVLNSQFLDRADNNRLRNGHVTTAAILPGKMIAAGLSDGGGVYVFSHEGRLLHHISDETTSIRESTVTSMYCDYASNSQLWFCTRGFINRAYVSLPAYEFGSAAGIVSIPEGITESGDSVFVSTEDGIYKNYRDKSGVVRFRKLEEPSGRINDLISIRLPEGGVLMAASSDGLWQTDNEGYATRILGRVHLTALESDKSESTILMAGSDDARIRTLIYSDEEWSVVNISGSDDLCGKVKEIEQLGDNDWWILTTSPASLVVMRCGRSDTTFIKYDGDRGVISDTLNHIVTIDDKLYVCTGRGLWCYNSDSDSFETDHDLIGNTFDNVLISNLFKTPEGDIFLTGFDIRNFDALVTATRQGHVVFKRQFDFLPDIVTRCVAYVYGNIWIAKGQSIFIIDKSKLGFSYGAFTTFFTRITAGDANMNVEGSFYNDSPAGIRIPSVVQPDNQKPALRRSSNNITFRWTSTSYVGEGKTEYRYRLDEFNTDWSRWERRTDKEYMNLPSGDYVFRLKSKTITGLESDEITYTFSVRKPWFSSLVTITFYVLAAAALFYYLIRHYARRLKVRNTRLRDLMKQHTEAAEKAKGEMAVLEQYAGTIQQALMPSEKILFDAVRNSFILNKPKNAVSGDFYWMARRGDSFFTAVGDWTGHGVPAALNTLMGLSFLDEIGNRQIALRTSVIMSEFRRKLIAAQKRSGMTEGLQAGIIIGLLAIDRVNGSVGFSGAGAQCFRVREMSEEELERWNRGEMADDEGILANGKYMLETIYGDRVPEVMHSKTDREFTQHEWKLAKNTSYYLFTDGYSDQFNGVSGKKFMKKNFRKLILDIQNYPMSKQKEMLEGRLKSWMGSSPQTDDILVVGFKIE
jgi:ligand-binding sensor domain-containing protein